MWEEIIPIDPEMWNWEKNPEVDGILVSAESGVSRKTGKTFCIYEVEISEGEKARFFGTKILDARLQNCELGMKVRINFLGMAISSTGYPYQTFKVEKWKDIGDGDSSQHGFRDTTKPTEPIDLSEAIKDKEEIDVREIPF